MKKQTLFFLLILMPLMTSAATYINGLYYNLNSTNKVAEVTSVPYGASKYTGSIVIPNMVAYEEITYSVTSIEAYAFWDCSSLTSITIPNSVTSIGEGAFRNCSDLTSAILGNGVETIEYEVFYGCSGLTSITIPNCVTSIGEGAFYNCI